VPAGFVGGKSRLDRVSQRASRAAKLVACSALRSDMLVVAGMACAHANELRWARGWTLTVRGLVAEEVTVTIETAASDLASPFLNHVRGQLRV